VRLVLEELNLGSFADYLRRLRERLSGG